MSLLVVVTKCVRHNNVMIIRTLLRALGTAEKKRKEVWVIVTVPYSVSTCHRVIVAVIRKQSIFALSTIFLPDVAKVS